MQSLNDTSFYEASGFPFLVGISRPGTHLEALVSWSPSSRPGKYFVEGRSATVSRSPLETTGRGNSDHHTD